MSHISYRQWAGAGDFATGTFDGTEISRDRLVMAAPVAGALNHDGGADRTGTAFDTARWTSPVVTPGFEFSELLASWNTATPAGTWIEVSVVVTTEDGAVSSDYSLGRWAMGDDAITRSSVPGQGDGVAGVDIDVLQARPGVRLVSYQTTLTLHRRDRSATGPEVYLLGVMASALPEQPPEPVRSAVAGPGVVLDVPAFSQELHKGRYPHLNGGGESWCSAASTAMVLSYFGSGPTAADYTWVDPSYGDPWVIHAASHMYDAAYGTGNWSFNTAYASELGLRGFVTRLRSLDEAAQFIAAGIPLVASLSFAEDALAGAGYATEGHLMVVVGFTDTGDVVVNDPASHLIASNLEVQTVYDAEQFTAAWLAGSGGIVYVIHPPDLPLPPPPAEANW